MIHGDLWQFYLAENLWITIFKVTITTVRLLVRVKPELENALLVSYSVKYNDYSGIRAGAG